jgi:hypothetical protein
MEKRIMRKSIVLIAVALAIAGCNRSPKVDTVREEVLSKDMVTPEIEVTHTGCSFLSKAIGRDCKVVRIDSSATAVSNGGSNWNRETALRVACDNALANVSHWMGQRVTSERNTRTAVSNTESSNSQENQSSAAEGNTEQSTRANDNASKRELTNLVRVQSQRFLKGWKPVYDGSPVVGAQEVKCTQRWDIRDEEFLRQVSYYNGN